MTITLIGAAQTAGTSANTVTVNVPTGTTTGHLMVVSLSFNTDATITTPTGWTLAATLGAAAGALFGAYYRWAGASEPASYTFSGTASTASSAILATYSGVDSTTPLDVTPVSTSGTGTSLNVGPITTASAAALLHYASVARSSSDTVTVDAALTLLAQSTARRQSAGYETLTTAGTSTARAFGGSTSVPRSGIVVALRPASLSTTGDVKVWNGSSEAAKPVKVWTGTAWVRKPVKRWTGTAWRPTSY